MRARRAGGTRALMWARVWPALRQGRAPRAADVCVMGSDGKHATLLLLLLMLPLLLLPLLGIGMGSAGLDSRRAHHGTSSGSAAYDGRPSLCSPEHSSSTSYNGRPLLCSPEHSGSTSYDERPSLCSPEHSGSSSFHGRPSLCSLWNCLHPASWHTPCDERPGPSPVRPCSLARADFDGMGRADGSKVDCLQTRQLVPREVRTAAVLHGLTTAVRLRKP